MARTDRDRVVTAQNRELYVAFLGSLEENASSIIEMLEEDDFPVEFQHSNGIHRVFWGPDDLRAYIEQLRQQLQAA